MNHLYRYNRREFGTFEKVNANLLTISARQDESEHKISRRRNQILAAVAFKSHGTVGDYRAELRVPKDVAVRRVVSDQIPDRIAAEQKLSRGRQQAGTRIAGANVGMAPDDFSGLVIDGLQAVASPH